MRLRLDDSDLKGLGVVMWRDVTWRAMHYSARELEWNGLDGFSLGALRIESKRVIRAWYDL
jgi:hypothetical protein